MKSKNRRSHRSYSGRRRSERNRSKLAVVLIVLFIIAVVIGSVFLGKYLKTKAELSEANRTDSDTVFHTETSPDNEKNNILFSSRPPERIEAGYIPLDVINSLEGEVAFASVVLRGKKGELYYSSGVAQTLGGQIEDNTLMSAQDIVALLDEKSEYISAVFSLMEHSEESGITTDAIHAYEQALIGEIAAAGADDILLCVSGAIDAERVNMLCEFSEHYRASEAEEIPLGLVLPYSFFTLENANELCRSLSEFYEFLAVDYTDVAASEEITVGEAIRGRIDTMQMYLSRYSLRVILDARSIDTEEAKSVLAEAAVYSFQTIDADLVFEHSAPEDGTE